MHGLRVCHLFALLLRSWLLEPVNRSNPVAPFKDSRSFEESRYKDGERTPDPHIFPPGPLLIEAPPYDSCGCCSEG